MKTLSVAKLRLVDLEKSERGRTELNEACDEGKLTFGGAMAIFEERVKKSRAQTQNEGASRRNGYPIVVFDALRVKIRDGGSVQNKAVPLALGIRADGLKEVLGLWIESNEGAKFWLQVMTELKNRGVQDILIAVVDGLKGFPDAINAVFPQTEVQTCIVHLVRHSLSYVGWQDRKLVAEALRTIYRAETAELARQHLDAFATGKWGQKYPTIVAAWRHHQRHRKPAHAAAQNHQEPWPLPE
jgi:transposase-like protein